MRKDRHTDLCSEKLGLGGLSSLCWSTNLTTLNGSVYQVQPGGTVGQSPEEISAVQ